MLTPVAIEQEHDGGYAEVLKDVSLACSVQLCPSGVGACTFRVNLATSASAESVLDHVLRLPRWERQEQRRHRIRFGERSHETMWDLFLAVIGGLKGHLGVAVVEEGADLLWDSTSEIWRPRTEKKK